jgi:succinylglutamate desuccinylase
MLGSANDYKEEIMKPYEKLCEYISTLEYGAVVAHGEIEKITGYMRGASQYSSSITRANKQLIEKSKALKNIRDVGYQVLMPDDYSSAAIREYKRGFRRLTAGENLLIAAPENQMTDDGRRAYRDVTDKARILHASLAGGIVELKLLNKKHPLLPANSR